MATKKKLREIDAVYSSVINYMSKEEKIKYCESLIKETEDFLGNKDRTFDERALEKYKALISAARSEMASLQKED